MNAPIVFFIDPQSYNNLSIYDYGVLQNVSNVNIYYFGNKLYDYKPINATKKSLIYNYSKKRHIFKVISYLSSLSFLFIQILRIRPKIIHVQWIRLFSIEYPIYYIAKRIFGCRLVFTVHNILPRRKKKNTVKQYQKLYNLFDTLIAHTETTKDNLITQFNIFANKIHIIPHGLLSLNSEEDKINTIKTEFINKYKLKGKIIFSHLGTQSKYKGSDLLIEAWLNDKRLSNRDDIALVIAGKFNNLNPPSTPSKNMIVIPRILNNDEFKVFLSLTDVMLMPYREIDQSGMLLTLISEEIPFCVSNAGELSRPLDFANIGWKFDNISDKAISDKILDIINNPISIRNKKNNKVGWNKLKSLYDWEKISQKTSLLYHSLINDTVTKCE